MRAHLIAKSDVVDAEHLSVAVSTQSGGDHDGLRHDTTVLADVQVGGVEHTETNG
jgi:hypothetical protein